MTTSIDGFSFEVFGENYTTVALDRTLMVQIHTSGVQVSAIAPAAFFYNGQTGVASAFRNGFQVNCSGNSPGGNTSHQVFDGRCPNFNGNASALPITVYPGDVLLIASSSPERSTATIARPNFVGTDGFSYVDKMLAVAFVDFDPTAKFRPFGIGASLLVKILRSSGIPHALLDTTVSALPNAFAASSVSSTGPTLSYLISLVSSFGGEVIDNWPTRQTTPNFQHIGYGSEFAGHISKCLVYLCSDASTADKKSLALHLVQWGLDEAGAFADGRTNQANGGHMQGRKALIILAGKLLGIPQMLDPDTFMVELFGTARFQENDAHYNESNAWWNGWDYGWRHNSDNTNWQELRLHPSSWSAGFKNNTFPYYGQVLGCQVGSVLAMRLLGLTDEFGVNIDGGVQQFMDEVEGSATDSALDAQGIHIDWNKDWSVGQGALWCSNVWKLLGQ